MSAKLTPAQKRLLALVLDGKTLSRVFDVWGGYWWQLDGKQIDSRSPERLLSAGAISLGEPYRPFSGRRTWPAQALSKDPRP